jgi:DNA-binding HxlR family transcriptional regulator
MKGYGQFCPVAKATELLGERWTLLVIRELLCGSTRFNDLRRGVPLMSPSLLSQRLKMLERAGIVTLRRDGAGYEYQLTAAGRELRTVVETLGVWGHRWARTDLDRADLDPALLMWDMHRRLNRERLPAQRTVLRFEFSDVFDKKRVWWLVLRRGEVDVCLKDPGHEVDLHISARVKALTAVWIGDMSLREAIDRGLVKVQGPSPLARQFGSWLALSEFAGVRPAVGAPSRHPSTGGSATAR